MAPFCSGLNGLSGRILSLHKIFVSRLSNVKTKDFCNFALILSVFVVKYICVSTFSIIRLIVYGPLSRILGPLFHHGNCVGTSEHPALLASSENSSRKFTTCNQFSGQHWAAMSEKINEYSIVHICSPSHCPFAPAWWSHQMETFSALLAFCAGNSPVTGEFPAQRPVTRSFDISLICAWING